MTMKKISDPMDDPRWIAFRTAIEARGHSIKGLWHASDGIIIWAVSDGPNGPPKYRTIVTRFYEGGGFGVWLESRTSSFADGAHEIIFGGPMPEAVPVKIVPSSGGFFVQAMKGDTPFNAMEPGVTFDTEAEALEAVRKANVERGTNFTNPKLGGADAPQR